MVLMRLGLRLLFEVGEVVRVADGPFNDFKLLLKKC